VGRQLSSPFLELGLTWTDRFDLDSVDLSVFSVEALDEVLGLASLSVASEDDLLKRLLNLDDEYRPLLRRIAIVFLSAAGLAILVEHLAFPPEYVFSGILDQLIRLSGLNSAIVRDFPKLFEDFKDKQFSLLWRGSRDGFGIDDFHRCCDGHPNTLTVILDTDENIFGGFTPVEWESPTQFRTKADLSLKSFLFTLKNPHSFPARKFALKARKKNEALLCWSTRGPDFCDIGVCDNSNASTGSYTSNFGDSYINDTRLDGKTFFTGSHNFQVKEIEVFEITN
jgi:hypothetical protein